MTSATPIQHPSLVLGGVIDRGVLALVSGLAAGQSRIDTAHERLNSYVLMKRSLGMTLNELRDLGADITTLQESLKSIDDSIKLAASEYVTTCIDAETTMQKQRDELARAQVGELIESPLDFSASTVQHLPLSADSMKLDAQYFSCTEQSEEDVAANVERFVRESMGTSGARVNELAKQASAQVARQLKNNSLAGTLVITANCSHKDVAVFSPLVVDPDKAIAAWNRLFPSDALPAAQSGSMAAMAAVANAPPARDAGGNSLALVSGVTYGSSFVGMAHLLKAGGANVGLDETALKKLRDQMRLGSWLEQASGGFGVDDETLNDVKRALSSQSVNAHVSVLVAGALPEIVSNEVKLTVSQVLQPEATQSLKLLKVVTGDPSESADTLDSEANRSRAVAQAANLQSARTSSMIRTLKDVDRASNRALDVDSLMKAFESYVGAIRKSGTGVPTGFFVRSLSKQDIANLWLRRHSSAAAANGKSETSTASGKSETAAAKEKTK